MFIGYQKHAKIVLKRLKTAARRETIAKLDHSNSADRRNKIAIIQISIKIIKLRIKKHNSNK